MLLHRNSVALLNVSRQRHQARWTASQLYPAAQVICMLEESGH